MDGVFYSKILYLFERSTTPLERSTTPHTIEPVSQVQFVVYGEPPFFIPGQVPFYGGFQVDG